MTFFRDFVRTFLLNEAMIPYSPRMFEEIWQILQPYYEFYKGTKWRVSSPPDFQGEEIPESSLLDMIKWIENETKEGFIPEQQIKFSKRFKVSVDKEFLENYIKKYVKNKKIVIKQKILYVDLLVVYQKSAIPFHGTMSFDNTVLRIIFNIQNLRTEEKIKQTIQHELVHFTQGAARIALSNNSQVINFGVSSKGGDKELYAQLQPALTRFKELDLNLKEEFEIFIETDKFFVNLKKKDENKWRQAVSILYKELSKEGVKENG